MTPKTVFITGSNRGIGLGLVYEILKLPDVEILIAGARNVTNAKELQDLAEADKRLHLLAIDVTNDDSIKNAVCEVQKIVGSKGLNLLINNAGICEEYGGTTSPDRNLVSKCGNVNAISALITAQYFLPLLKQAAFQTSAQELSVDRASIINIGSDCSSQTLSVPGVLPRHLAYKMSKVAMLSFGRSLAADFEVENIPVLVTTIHPGWVLTDMGGEDAELTVDESVTKIVAGFAKLNKNHAGGLFDIDLKAMPF